MVSKNLENLKKTLHPEMQIDIITQCEIVSKALEWGGEFDSDIHSLAAYLEISTQKLNQMKRVVKDMVPELQEWFRGSTYQCRTAYDKAVLPHEEQRAWLHNMTILVTGRDSLSQKVKKDE